MPCTAHTCAHAYCGACRGRGRLLPGQGSALRTATRPGQDSAPGRRHGRGRTPVAPSGAQRAPPAQGPGSSAHLRGGPVRSTHRAPRAAQRLQRSCARGRACGSDAVRAPHGAGGAGLPGAPPRVALLGARGRAPHLPGAAEADRGELFAAAMAGAGRPRPAGEDPRADGGERTPR
nr:RLORF1 [Gallid alphaherpesvirus 2]WOL21672.1 RLORF1 [Gallid alphaherpesvirus 2]